MLSDDAKKVLVERGYKDVGDMMWVKPVGFSIVGFDEKTCDARRAFAAPNQYHVPDVHIEDAKHWKSCLLSQESAHDQLDRFLSDFERGDKGIRPLSSADVRRACIMLFVRDQAKRRIWA